LRGASRHSCRVDSSRIASADLRARIDISRGIAADYLRTWFAAIHHGIFLMPETRGVAPERMKRQLRTRAKSLAPQYVMPRTTSTVSAIKNKEIFNR